MGITECYDIENIVREAEAALQIDGRDYGEDVDAVISQVKQRIGRAFQIDLNEYKMSDPELSLGVYRAQAMMFASSMALVHSKLCGLAQIQRYLTKTGLSLSRLNYLGYTAHDMKTVMISLQRKVTLPSMKLAIDAIKEKMPVIGNCMEKRLFMILIIADAVGFPEIVATIAEIFHQAMI